jgi:hypothetical protein
MNIKVHPAAECVRLMDEEELASLAASIEAHGQRDPIIMGRVNGAASEMLVDGRNRLRACEIAGVEPRFEVIQFEDDEAIKAFVADKSEHRNLTKGQQAMRLAFLYPEPEKGGRGKKGKAPETGGFSRQRLGAARAVLAYSRELALAVRDGAAKLDEALATAKAQRADLESNEQKLARLRSDAPDLAEQVDEGRFSLGEAFAAFEQRLKEAAAQEQSRRETMIRVASGAYINILALGVPEFLADLDERIDDQDFRAELVKYMRIEAREAFSSIEQGADALAKLVKTLKE